MDIRKLIEYKNWADNIYIEYCKGLADNEFEYKIEGYDNNIKQILGHMYEVNLSWYHFIINEKFSEGPDLKKMSKDEIIANLIQYNQKILELTDTFDLSKIYQIQWGLNDKVVETTAENIIFNFVTHSAYHRGQLAIYLRLIGKESIIETDFNPYVYTRGQE